MTNLKAKKAVPVSKGIIGVEYETFLKEYATVYPGDSFVEAMVQRIMEGRDLTPKMTETIENIKEEWWGQDAEVERRDVIKFILAHLTAPTNQREREFIESLREWSRRVTPRQASYLRRVAANQVTNVPIQEALITLNDIEEGNYGQGKAKSTVTEARRTASKAGAGKAPTKPHTDITEDDIRELEEFEKALEEDIRSSSTVDKARGVFGNGSFR